MKLAQKMIINLYRVSAKKSIMFAVITTLKAKKVGSRLVLFVERWHSLSLPLLQLVC